MIEQQDEIQSLNKKMDIAMSAVQLLAASTGARLSREQLCQRFRVHRNTLAKILRDPDFPRPDRTGHYWLLEKIIEWERR